MLVVFDSLGFYSNILILKHQTHRSIAIQQLSMIVCFSLVVYFSMLQ
jgi:hypothetical protein